MAKSRRRRPVLLVAALMGVGVLALAGCAAGPNDAAGVGDPDVAGFWLGLWQGAISPITFIVSLFNPDVGIYEIHNNGNWYDFGFMIGVSAVFSGGAGGGAASGRRRRR
ncbi:MAG: hypothetical protein ACOH2F_14755 [Cellulomonas sp.]